MTTESVTPDGPLAAAVTADTVAAATGADSGDRNPVDTAGRGRTVIDDRVRHLVVGHDGRRVGVAALGDECGRRGAADVLHGAADVTLGLHVDLFSVEADERGRGDR